MARVFLHENKLSADYVRSILHYEPETGCFTWLKRMGQRSRVRIGDIAGSINSIGRRFIKIKGRNYLGSRVAVVWMTGHWPADQVDHRDRDGANDRWANLREASRAQNAVNRIIKRKHALPRGVTRQTGGKKFMARITVGGQCKYLGSFDTPEEAHAVYMRHAAHAFGQYLPTELSGK